ncbi:MAG: YIP1 family protein [bacterium]|nr:YIP1 family protein [bacterium]
MEDREVNFYQWFIGQFCQILKSSRMYWNKFNNFEFSNRVFWFGFICLTVGIGFEALMQIFMSEYTQIALAGDAELAGKLAGILGIEPEKFTEFFADQLILLKKQNVLQLALLPFISYFFIYLFASAIHMVLKIFGYISTETKFTYDTTLSIVCFSLAPAVFALIPLVGSMIATVWILLLLVRGVSKIYSLTFWQSISAVLFPAFLIKMLWTTAVASLVLALPTVYFEEPLWDSLQKGFSALF